MFLGFTIHYTVGQSANIFGCESRKFSDYYAGISKIMHGPRWRVPERSLTLCSNNVALITSY